MTKESEIKVGRPENKARYEECVSKIKKAFADYIGATRNKVEKRLTWTGKKYVLREDGSFLRKDSKRDNIKELEMDVASFVEFVAKQTPTTYDSKNSKSNSSISITHLSDLVDKVLPEMSCAIARPVGNDLYWVTKGEYNGYNFDDFRQLVEDNTTFNMIYTIPLKYSSFNFEKDSHSGCMDSCEVKCCGEPKKIINLESLFTRALSVIDFMGVVDGKFVIYGVTINVVRKKNIRVEIVVGDTVVTLRADNEKKKILYSYSCPSTEDLDESLTNIGVALERFCDANVKESFASYEIKKIESDEAASDPDYDALVRLLAGIFR